MSLSAWWLRPAVRIAAALALPWAVPALITGLLWALPGDPAEIICPRELCEGTSALAARWNLDDGPVHFYTQWLAGALQGDLGNSWRVLQGVPVADLLVEAIPTTLLLTLGGAVPLLLAAAAGASGRLPRRVDDVLSVSGLVPAVVLALLGAAIVDLRYGGDAWSEDATRLRLLLGAGVLGLADGAVASAMSGVRALFERERSERYVGVATLRGEGELANMLPNVVPALTGQMRARLLQLLSATVVVEVVLRIDGVGDLLWKGTLLQDFGLVLGAATFYAVVSAAFLLTQGLVEIAVAAVVRRAPAVGLEPLAPPLAGTPS